MVKCSSYFPFYYYSVPDWLQGRSGDSRRFFFLLFMGNGHEGLLQNFFRLLLKSLSNQFGPATIQWACYNILSVDFVHICTITHKSFAFNAIHNTGHLYEMATVAMLVVKYKAKTLVLLSFCDAVSNYEIDFFLHFWVNKRKSFACTHFYIVL